jgi:tetratricopeptide (TPR) repeat protein
MKKKQKISNTKLALSKAQIDSVIDLYSSGQISEAIDLIKKLNNQYPNVPLLYNILGACYKVLGQLENAEKMFNTAFSIKPDYAEAHFNHGIILKGLNRIDEAIKSYQNAIAILPNYPDAHNNLGNAFREKGQINDAIICFEWAIAYKPEFVQALNNLGNAQRDIGMQRPALINYKKAFSIDPSFLDSLFNLGVVQKELGLKEEARKSFEKILESQPKNLKVLRNLCDVKKFTNRDTPLIKNIKLILENNSLEQSELIDLNLSLSKIYGDLGDLDKQFKFLSKGNSLRKNLSGYSIASSTELFSKLKKIFKSESVISQSLKKNTTINPIFIVGMPRSGTSLVEQIIASHNEVFGSGELEFLSQILAPIISQDFKLNENTKKLIRNQYLSKLKVFKINEKKFTDKMPMNFRYIGFILYAFPEAKIIHLKRDARATCWSIFKSYFDSDGIGYSNDQKDLAKYYGLYSDLMSFWHELYPNQIYDICYEDLTTNQEEETRKLLAYCDLEWDKNCLNFHTNDRAVKTASALQVRKKMYQGSSEAWKKYEPYLKPLINGLESY